MKAKEILTQLLAKNAAYAKGEIAAIDHSKDLEMSSKDQHPEAVVVSCLDSRVPVERIFNKGVGDLFVARVAGNVMNADIVGSLEFAILMNNVKVVIILGHTSCGAVKGACANARLGSLTQLLEKIKPAKALAEKNFATEQQKSEEFYDAVALKNAELAALELCNQSPDIAKLHESGEIIIQPALYDLKTQLVSLGGIKKE